MARVIEFEGIDGSGKTTAYTFFCDQLEAKGYKVLRTREVGSPHIPVCAALRKLILNPETKMNGAAMEFIFAAMRIENQDFYRKVSGEYDFIVSDRGWLSHLSYTDHNVSTAFTENFYLTTVKSLTAKPDRVVYMDVHPDTAAARRNIRGEVKDAIELKGLEFQKQVANSFRKYMETEGVIVSKIDANGNISEVEAQLSGLISDITN